jgi:hypothetical protein
MLQLSFSKVAEIADVAYLSPYQHLLTQSEGQVLTSDGTSILQSLSTDSPSLHHLHASSSHASPAHILTADWPNQLPQTSPQNLSPVTTSLSILELNKAKNISSTEHSIHLMSASPLVPTGVASILSSDQSHSHHTVVHSILLAVVTGGLLRVFPVLQPMLSNRISKTHNVQPSSKPLATLPSLPPAASATSGGADDDCNSTSCCELSCPLMNQRWLALSWHPHIPGILAAVTQVNQND